MAIGILATNKDLIECLLPLELMKDVRPDEPRINAITEAGGSSQIDLGFLLDHFVFLKALPSLFDTSLLHGDARVLVVVAFEDYVGDLFITTRQATSPNLIALYRGERMA